MADELHCIPTDDLVEHEAHEDCACGPACMPVERTDSIGWIYLHHSLDRREMREVGSSPGLLR